MPQTFYAVHSAGENRRLHPVPGDTPSSGWRDLGLLAVIYACVAIALPASQLAFGWLGALASRTLLKGPPFNDPLKVPKTLHKFKHSAWQLVIHIV